MIKHHQSEMIRQLEYIKGWRRGFKERRKRITDQWRGAKRWQRCSKRQWGGIKGYRRVAKRRLRGAKERLKSVKRKWVVIKRQWGGVEGQWGGGERQGGDVKGKKEALRVAWWHERAMERWEGSVKWPLKYVNGWWRGAKGWWIGF